MSELQELLENIECAFGIRICVHDISGITLTIKALELPYLWKTHGGEYCSEAKMYTSERLCMKQKLISLFQLKRNGVKPYCGICRMGVCEYLEPVFLDGNLVAVVFASVVILSKQEEALTRLKSHYRNDSSDKESLISCYMKFSEKAGTTEKQLKFFAELVRDRIVKSAQNSAHRIPTPDNQYPVESVRYWRDGRTAALLSYLEENYHTIHSLKEISQRFLLSEGHINRLVSREVHMGAMAYIKQLRLEVASKQLLETDDSVNEIGECVGYKDTNYFCRVFKKTYGYTPTEYREYGRKNYKHN